MAYIPESISPVTDQFSNAAGSFAKMLYQQKRDADQLRFQEAQVGAMELNNSVMQQLDSLPPDQWVQAYPKLMNEGLKGMNLDFAFKDTSASFGLGMRQQIARAIPGIYQKSQAMMADQADAANIQNLQATTDISMIPTVGDMSLNNAAFIRKYGSKENAELAVSDRIAQRSAAIVGQAAQAGGIVGRDAAKAQMDTLFSAYLDKDGKFKEGLSTAKKAQFERLKGPVQQMYDLAFKAGSEEVLTTKIAEANLAETSIIDYNSGKKTGERSFASFNDFVAEQQKLVADDSLDSIMTADDQKRYLNELNARSAGYGKQLEDDVYNNAMNEWYKVRTEKEAQVWTNKWYPLVGQDKKQDIVNWGGNKGHIISGIGAEDGLAAINQRFDDMRKSIPSTLNQDKKAELYEQTRRNEEEALNMYKKYMADTRGNANITPFEQSKQWNDIVNGAKLNIDPSVDVMSEALAGKRRVEVKLSDGLNTPEENFIHKVLSSSINYSDSQSLSRRTKDVTLQALQSLATKYIANGAAFENFSTQVSEFGYRAGDPMKVVIRVDQKQQDGKMSSRYVSFIPTGKVGSKEADILLQEYSAPTSAKAALLPAGDPVSLTKFKSSNMFGGPGKYDITLGANQ